MKRVSSIFGVILIAIVAVAVYVYLNLGSLIKQGIETYAPPLVGVDVNVDSVDLMPITGAGSISGFTIANPSGYGDGKAIGLGNFQLKLDTASLVSDVIVIEKILIDTPELNFIQGEGTNSNFQQLLENIEANTTSSTDNNDDPSNQNSGATPKLIIDSFGLHNVVITAVSPLLPNDSLQLPVPDINLTALGRKTNGAYPEDIAKEVAEQLLAAAKTALLNSNIYKDKIKQAAKQKLEAEKARLKAKADTKRQALEDDARNKLDEKLGDKKDLLKALFN